LARTVWQSPGTTSVEAGPLPEPGSCTLPFDWAGVLGSDFRGRVRYLRSFGRPSRLAPGDRVDLLVERIEVFGCLALNGIPLGEIPPGQFNTRVDVTHLLKSRNLLAIEVELPRVPRDPSAPPPGSRDGSAGGLVGEVRLEIHAAGTATDRHASPAKA
jgi:hypothetical protein